MFGLDRVVIVDLIRDITSNPGGIIYKIGILIVESINDKGEKWQPHIEMSYQFEQQYSGESARGYIIREEAETMVKILKNLFSDSGITVYAMYDAYKTIPPLDSFLKKYGYSNTFRNMRILDIKTISRDRMPPPYILKNLARHYELSELFKEGNSPIDNAKLLLEILLKIEKYEKGELYNYINLIGFLDEENHHKLLPFHRVRVLPQKTNHILKLYEGFDWNGYKFRSISEGDNIPIFRVEKDSKYGLAIPVDDLSSIYDILLPCEYDNVFLIDRPHQELFIDSKYDTFIYSCYLILVKDGKQGLCKLIYNQIRPNMRSEYSLHFESDIEYDHITVCNNRGYILQKGKKNRYYSINKRELSKSFLYYMFLQNNYLMYRREDGTYVLDTFKDKEYKMASNTDEHISHIGSSFFVSSYFTDRVFMITDNGVKQFEDYKYEYSIYVRKEQHIVFPESYPEIYVVVSGPRGLGVLDSEGELVVSPEQDEITAELLLTYSKGEHQEEKKIEIKKQWLDFD